MKQHYKIVIATIFFCSTFSSFAVLPWNGGTDGSGNFLGGVNSWTGGVTGGTVQANVPTNPAEGATALVINDFSSGTMSITFNNQLRLQTTITATFDLTILGGGTADLFFNNRNNNDGGLDTWEGISLTGFTGNVTGIEAVITYSSPVATRNHSPLNNSRPMMSGLAVINLDGTDPMSYEISTSLGGVYSDPLDNNIFVPGLSAGLNTPVLIGDGILTGAVGSTSASATQFVAVNQFLIIRGFDNNGNTDGFNTTLSDRTYARSQSWSLTRDGGAAFASNSSFVFSMDGQQYANWNVVPIPEPSVFLSVFGGLFFLLVRRSRK